MNNFWKSYSRIRAFPSPERFRANPEQYCLKPNITPEEAQDLIDKAQVMLNFAQREFDEAKN